MVWGVLALFFWLVTTALLTRLAVVSGFVEHVLLFFAAGTAVLIPLALLLSLFDALALPWAWAVLTGLVCALVMAFVFASAARRGRVFRPINLPSFKRYRNIFHNLSPFWKLILLLLLGTTLLLAMLNLVVVLTTVPHNRDSMAYHLTRVAYYLQYGNLDRYFANQWAQIVHQKNPAILLLFTYIAGNGYEPPLQLIQFVSYCVAAVAVFGIVRSVLDYQTDSPRDKSPGVGGVGQARNVAYALFGALVFMLLIVNIMESTTTQNDMLATAYVGCVVYGLFAYRRTQQVRYLLWSGFTFGLAIGVKATVMTIVPSLLLIAAYTIAPTWRRIGVRDVIKVGAVTLVSLFLFAFMTGYGENIVISGHPVGPQFVRESHSFEGQAKGDFGRNGILNLARLSMDNLSLDGLPNVTPITQAQTALTWLPATLLRATGLPLESDLAVRTASDFQLNRPPSAYEDQSYWGVAGFLFIWPAVFLIALRVVKSHVGFVLAWATLLFVIVQAFSGPYDPFRGRYFTMISVIAVPAAVCCIAALPRRWRTSRLLRGYAVVTVLAMCLTAWVGIVFRTESTLLTVQYGDTTRQSVFAMTRSEQVMRGSTPYSDALAHYEQRVPIDATVAVLLDSGAPEYALFGEGLTRTLVPVRWQDVPSSADFLLFSTDLLPDPLPTDTHLGADWYLRHLEPQ